MSPSAERRRRSAIAIAVGAGLVLVGIVAVDAPWWFGTPTGTFPVREGRVTDVGAVALHVHAR